MKKNTILSLILVLCILCSMAPAFATGGAADDPLVSRSYVDGSYRSSVLSASLKSLSDALTVLRYKLSVSSGMPIAVKPSSLSLRAGDTITAYAGSSFTVLSGSLKVNSLTGNLLDISTGSTVSPGQNLNVGHRYVSAEVSVSALYASSTASVAALGKVVKTAGTNVQFNDVSSNDWFFSDVYYAVEKGLINGKSATIYDPNGTMTYSETIKLAACIHQLYNTGSISLANASAPNKWYADYVQYALNKGIISTSISNYEALISRGEFIAIFYASMPKTEYASKNTVGDGNIPDVPMNHKYSEEIYAFYRAGIIVGADSVGSASPDRGLMRSEVAAVINRMYEVSARKSIIL